MVDDDAADTDDEDIEDDDDDCQLSLNMFKIAFCRVNCEIPRVAAPLSLSDVLNLDDDH